MFSDEDIKKALEDYQNNPEYGLYIEPFAPKSVTPVGYDLRVGEERIKNASNQEENKRKTENANRERLLIFLIIVVSVGGIAASSINSTAGSSIAAFLAVIAPVVYDKFLKPVSKS